MTSAAAPPASVVHARLARNTGRPIAAKTSGPGLSTAAESATRKTPPTSICMPPTASGPECRSSGRLHTDPRQYESVPPATAARPAMAFPSKEPPVRRANSRARPTMPSAMPAMRRRDNDSSPRRTPNTRRPIGVSALLTIAASPVDSRVTPQ